MSGLFDRFRRRFRPDAHSEEADLDGPVYPTRALGKFLAGLGVRPQAALLDLGPVVGRNVTFFGEELGCKIFVEDVSKDIDRHVREGALDRLPAFLRGRFPQADGTVDGVLSWDIFDYLDRPAAQALAAELVRVLRPDGVLLGFFAAGPPNPDVPPTYTRHIVVSRDSLQYRPYPAARGRQRPLQNREIQRLFEPLRVTDQFLLKTNVREVLLRKPGA